MVTTTTPRELVEEPRAPRPASTTPRPVEDGALAELVIAPVPIDLPRAGRRRALARSLRLALLAARHLTPVVGRKLVRRPGQSARAIRRMFETLGSTYVKFGQFIASAPGIVGEEMAEEFRTCLDTGPAVPFDRVRAIVEGELGRPLEDAFATFNAKPLASASIAVVHRATLHDGRAVAVKVLRPGIERMVATDLAMLEWLGRFAGRRGAAQAYDMVSLIAGLRAQIAEELDLRNEARTMDAFRSLFERFELSLLAIPTVHHELTERRVLTMEFLEGASIDDLAHAAAHGLDPAPLIRELLKAWVLTGVRAGAFHADIHAGNLLVMRDGRLGMIDWGIVARMHDQSQLMFRSLLEATLGRKDAWRDMASVMLEVNGPSLSALGLTDEQVVHFAQELFEPVLTRPMREVDMSRLMMNGDDVVRMATGEAPPRRTLRDRWRGLRTGAKAFRKAETNGTFENPTFRMGFLSMKQLIYLERYGKMYIPDESLLGDGAFVRQVLEGQ